MMIWMKYIRRVKYASLTVVAAVTQYAWLATKPSFSVALTAAPIAIRLAQMKLSCWRPLRKNSKHECL